VNDCLLSFGSLCSICVAYPNGKVRLGVWVRVCCDVGACLCMCFQCVNVSVRVFCMSCSKVVVILWVTTQLCVAYPYGKVRLGVCPWQE